MSEITPEKVADTPPTVERIASLLTETDSDPWEDYYWMVLTRAVGNVVEIGIEPSAADGTRLAEVHFRAEVVAVPTYSVATEPVTLPAEMARELAYGHRGDDIDEWTVVANEYVGTTRWSSTHRLVIRNEAGEHFADTYSRGLTESQEKRPYEDASTATFTPVAPTFRVVTEWKPAEAAQEQKGGAQ